MLKNSMPLEKL